jgi:hypothetical protein
MSIVTWNALSFYTTLSIVSKCNSFPVFLIANILYDIHKTNTVVVSQKIFLIYIGIIIIILHSFHLH